MDQRIENRLAQVSIRLGDASWIIGVFDAGDLVMVGVL